MGRHNYLIQLDESQVTRLKELADVDSQKIDGKIPYNALVRKAVDDYLKKRSND